MDKDLRVKLKKLRQTPTSKDCSNCDYLVEKADEYLMIAISYGSQVSQYKSLARELVEELETSQIVLDVIGSSKDITTWKLIAEAKEALGDGQ